jgi:hypothetical protein
LNAKEIKMWEVRRGPMVFFGWIWVVVRNPRVLCGFCDMSSSISCLSSLTDSEGRKFPTAILFSGPISSLLFQDFQLHFGKAYYLDVHDNGTSLYIQKMLEIICAT